MGKAWLVGALALAIGALVVSEYTFDQPTPKPVPKLPQAKPTAKPKKLKKASPQIERAFQEALQYIEEERPLIGEEQYKKDREEMLIMLRRARENTNKEGEQ